MKKTVLFSVVIILLVSMSLRAQSTLTVADGTETNSYIPVYGYYIDDYLREQVIYPESILAPMTGSSISEMTFYLANMPSRTWNATFEVKLGTTSVSAFSSSASSFLTGATSSIYTGTLTVNNNTMTVTFNTPFIYSGGNLLLDISSLATGSNYSSASFTGIQATGGSAYDYSSSSLASANDPMVQNFIPKTTFAFIPNNTCMHPFNLHVKDVAGSSAMVQWTNISTFIPDHYEVSYKQADATSWSTVPDAITSEYCMLTGLQPEADYMVRVRAFCDATTPTDYTETLTFTTDCSGGNPEGVVIGNTTSTGNSRYIPFSTSYYYNYSQSILTSGEMGGAKDLTALSLQYSYSSTVTRNLDIYLGHTTQNSFTSSSNWVSADNLTLVYSGEVTFNNSGENFWFTIPFNTTFHYNGTDNLVVAFDDNTNGYASAQYRFYTHSNSNYRSMVVSSSTNYTPASPGSGSRYYEVPNMMFTLACVTGGCDRANISALDVTDSSARLIFTSGSGNTGIELEYKRTVDDTYTALPTNGTSLLLTGLRPNTEYQVRIRSICPSGNSLWKQVTFTTGILNFPRLYVTTTGTGNGGSWETAYGDLNEALAAAEAIRNIHGTAPDIWVKEGTYYGDSISTNAFTIHEGINVYGGFSGLESESFDLSQRDFDAHPTILDGQHNQRVLNQESNFTTPTLWDGFTLQNGSVAGNGGGAFLKDMTNLSHCVVRDNTATSTGGGIYMYNSNSSKCGTIDHCTVTHNTASTAGGIFTRYGIMRYCIVTHNVATGNSGNGGGICTEFVNNSHITISNCLVANNTAANGGGIYNYNSCYVVNTTVVRNSSTANSSGVYGSPYLRNCIVWGNQKNGASNNVSSSAACLNTAVEGGFPGDGNISLLPESFDNGRYYPYFANPSATAGHTDSTANVDWHLLNTSVCVNRGSNTLVPTTDSTDLDGTARIKQGTVDMGCYESDFQSTTLPDYGNIIYVKVNGGGNHTGTSWDNALGSLTDALSLAQMYHTDIWVAEGIYYGDSVSASAFEMVDGVSLYGGFAGVESADYDISQRDLTAHVTILDGQRSQRLLNQSKNFTNSTVVDGFTIRNGYTTGSGGGIYLKSGSTLSNCTISHCRAEGSGGGAECYGSNNDSITISHCTFTHNFAKSYGGGLSCSCVRMSDCLFSYDTATSYQSGYGGGLSISNSNMVRCTLSHNYCNMRGGGMYTSYTNASQCEFTHNYCNNEGGGVYLSSGSLDSQIALCNCLIANNTAAYGAGIYNGQSNNLVRNLTVVCNNITSSNSNNTGAGVYAYAYSSSSNYSITIQNSVFWGNRSNGVVNNILKNNAGTTVTVSHCALEGGYEEGDNIVTLLPESAANGLLSPHFVNPALTAGHLDDTPNPDWRLADGSPCANKGDNSVADALDLDGNARVQQGVVDLGCYESPYTEVAMPTYNDGIVYVKVQGTGTGESWENAIGSIQAAIDIATTQHAVVWVAAGTYYGDTESDNAFTMRSGVSVYGGFAGNEPAGYDLSLRDFTANASILDGLGTRRVLYQPANFTAETAVRWDGFTIQNGWSRENGAGVYMMAYSTLSNCIVQYNTLAPLNNSYYNVYRQGGGIYASGSQVTVSGVKQRTSRISHCRIAHNVIENTNYLEANGGGVYAYQTDVDHSEICHNTTITSGGGLYISSEAKASNCLIHNNTAYRGGGLSSNSSSTVLNCDIVNNTATNNGGGYYRDGGTPTFTNCIIWGNKKDYAVNNISNTQGNYTFCAVEDGISGNGNFALASQNDGIDGSQYYVRFNDPESNDFSLHPTSACVNAGNSDVMTDSLDFYGFPRLYGTSVDIGCSEVQAQSNCPPVIGLQADNITSSSAHLSWHPTGSESQWVVVYGEQGGPTSTLTVNDTVCTLSGLALNRNYAAKVRANCGGGEMSVFSITVNFQTVCDPDLLDTLSDFSLMTPADNDIVYQNNVSFGWSNLPEATSYDLYIWAADGPEPSIPTMSGLTNASAGNVPLPNYARGKYYRWKVVAWNECISKSSPVMNLRVNPNGDLHVTSVLASTPVAGQPLTVTWTVSNDGEGSTQPGQTWSDYIWLSSDADVRYHADQANVRLATVTNLQALGSGESYTNTATVTLPEGIMGDFFLFVIAGHSDAYGIDFLPTGGTVPIPYTPSLTGNPYPYLKAGSHESSFTDDIIDSTFYDIDGLSRIGGHDNFFYIVLNILPPPSADLVVSSVAHPANTFSGSTIPLTWTVTNQGEASALDSWYDAVYLTSDTLLSTADAWRVGTYKHTGNLPIDSSYNQSINVTIPIDYMGDYNFFVITDNNDEIYEGFFNENNIGMSAHPLTVSLTPPADLIVTAIDMPDTVNVHTSYYITYSVKNNGSSPTYGNHWADAVYISRDSVFNNNARYVRQIPHNGVLAADSSYNKHYPVLIPTDLEGGLWYLFVKADDRNDIFEYTFENNNVSFIPITVILPDLAVTDIQVPDTVNPNTITRVTWRVRNNGPGDVVGRSFTDHIRLNGETIYTASTSNLNLASGESMVRSADLQLPCLTGTAVLTFVTDASEDVLEGNESNNTLVVPLSIHTPNLTINGVLLSENSLWSGTPCTVNYIIVNNGDMPVSGTVTDHIYFDQSATGIEGYDFVDAHTHTITLAPGEAETVTTTVNVPDGISGQYYCHVITNATGAVCEATPDDNTGHSDATSVQLSPWPDLAVTNVTVSDTVNLGINFPVTYTVANNGTADLHHAGAYSKFYYSISATQYDTSHLILTQMDYFNMAVGEEETHTAQVTIPATEAQRYYYIHIVTDATDLLYEHTDAGNNSGTSNSFLAKVYTLDLMAVEIDGPDVVEWGQTVTYRLHVRNNSEVPTLAPQWTDALYLSDDQVFQAHDHLLQSVSHQTLLDVGEDYWVNFPCTIPFGTDSTAYLLGYADFYSDNPDISPSNNSTLKAITVNSVPTPDLAISEAVIVGDVYSGQPAKIAYTVTNVGELDIALQTWRDKIFLSTNETYDNTDIELLTQVRQNVTLPQGASYTDTLTYTVPLPQNGSLYLIVKANAINNPFEVNQNNNTMAVPVNVILPSPGDLTITDITSESSIVSGSILHTSWNIQNIGNNPMAGNGLRSLVYISTDTVFDVNDRLIGNVATPQIYLNTGDILTQSTESRISGLVEGEYYLIVKTDVTNAFYEVDETNNTSYSLEPFEVTIRPLPFNTDVSDVLYNDSPSDFRMDVGNQIGQTVRIHLTTEDSLAGAINMIYATHNNMGDNLNYTYSTIGQYTANPVLYIPYTQAGHYGVNVYGNTPAGDEQNTFIRADILPFELLSVDADHGGNTGNVTVELTGSHFRPDMRVCLRNGGDTLCADSLTYVNYYKAFAHFDLTGRTPGVYDVSAENFCEGESVLYDGFEIQEGSPDGLAYNLIFPSAPRPNRNVVMMLEFANLGNLDLHNQVLEITCLGGCPIALTPEEVNSGSSTLLVPLNIEGQPEGLLRPGCYGTINIYGFTSGALVFTMKPVEQ